MFETLSGKLTEVFHGLGSKGRLTEKDIDKALREIRIAFLEADVNFKVVGELVAKIKERAIEEEVFKSLSPGQQVVGITNTELTNLLGTGVRNIESSPTQPSVVLMVGLNGSGKTTSAAKLAMHMKSAGQKPLLVAADLQRPAAVEQLQILGNQIDIPVYHRDNPVTTVDVTLDGIKKAAEINASWAIIDTAGRLQIDDDLMAELAEVKAIASPAETLLVVDAMTGQDSVNVANEFHERIGVTGLVLTKLDGDARGGAALSIVKATGVPIKFIGTGEKIEALEQFHPDRLASRILGMGDVLTLVEKAQKTFDEDQAVQLKKKIRQATFDLEDFLAQLQQLKSMGPLGQVLDMIPGFASLKSRMSSDELDDTRLEKIEAIIRSMTLEERRRPDIIGGSRRRRISQGSGTKPQDVNQLLNQFRQMQKQLRQFTSDKGQKKLARMKGFEGLF